MFLNPKLHQDKYCRQTGRQTQTDRQTETETDSYTYIIRKKSWYSRSSTSPTRNKISLTAGATAARLILHISTTTVSKAV